MRSFRKRPAVPPPTVAAIRARLRALADPRVAAASQRFFKTRPGEYGHGDRFLGVRVPTLRKVAREFRASPVAVPLALLRSPLHEERLVALFMLVDRYARGAAAERQRVYEQYLRHVPKHVNNWDLVDSSAHLIVGAHLEDKDRGVLYELARSRHLWERRIAIVATFWFIRRGSFDDTLEIAEICSTTSTTSFTKPRVGCCARSAIATAPSPSASCGATAAVCRARCCVTRSRSYLRARAAPISPVRSASRASTRS